MTTITTVGSYLVAPYLTLPYLTTANTGTDGVQFDAVTTGSFGVQFTAQVYNTTSLRVMCSFPSRGTAALGGTNWTSNSTATSPTSEFTVNNVNTDIVEQVFRSAIDTGLQLDCDTGLVQGVFVDTLVFINTNLTTSANITLIGSDNASHTPAGITIPMTTERGGNVIYIADDLPTIGYRYWRVQIDDSTNEDNYLQIGTIIFGPSLLLQEACFTDIVIKTPKNFTDEVFTEGFTNVKNDRGVKNAIRLDFRSIKYTSVDFILMEDIFNTARTILKCLWIPIPEVANRFLVFGKLKQIPQQRHNYKTAKSDLVDFSVEVDESL